MKACRRLVGLIVCLALAGSFAEGAGALGASALAGCRSFKFVHAGTSWKASSVRVTDASCLTAKNLIVSYARPRNCQFRFACHIDGYVCRTSSSRGSSFEETCVNGPRSVRWLGGYVSR